ncbi:hypothetical protein B0H13DRAFT_1204110 [Mycena leptocephala]|nr:hypothetical protein B0H13DRAFT_1204110 [Mycena leptocephala]
MAPELLLPEIYGPYLPFRRTAASISGLLLVFVARSGRGHVPFANMSDGGLIMAFSDREAEPESIIPYPSRPQDKGGQSMPEELWNLVQRCWKHEAAARPTVHEIANVISTLELTHESIGLASFTDKAPPEKPDTPLLRDETSRSNTTKYSRTKQMHFRQKGKGAKTTL